MTVKEQSRAPGQSERQLSLIHMLPAAQFLITEIYKWAWIGRHRQYQTSLWRGYR